MQPIDWLIVSGFTLGLVAAAMVMTRYTKSVADFLAANRCAKRYLLTAAEGSAGLGVISIVAQFELFQSAGFTAAYWEMMITPLMLVLALSGWVLYRFRQTRCLTLAQFFEIRYNRSFRIFAGLLAFLAGIINYGIAPAVTARFFVHALNLPLAVQIGDWGIPTYALLMLVVVGLGLYFALSGGQIVIMVTDFIQGQFINIVFVVATIAILLQISWSQVSSTLAESPPHASLVNPFDTAKAETFSFWYFLIFFFGKFYSYMCWQGSQGYNASAKSPHEARMARIFGQWRGGLNVLIPMTFAISALVLLSQPEYADKAAAIRMELQQIENPQIQTQVTTPIAMRYLLPAGILGLFIAVMVAAGGSGDSTYLHSWGSIFIQDVVMPLRRKPFSQKTHLLLLRLAILTVGVFIFFFSLLFRQTEYILLFFLLTGALFTAGAGVCIIGGLYWSRGTAAGAWGAMGAGTFLVLTGFVLDRLAPAFPLNYFQITFLSQLVAIAVYVIVSLATGRGRRFDMDRMLHRGVHAQGPSEPAPEGFAGALRKRLGINADFTRMDRMIYYATIGFGGALLVTFFGLLAWHILARPSHAEWMSFWWGFLMVKLAIAGAVTLWILIGGLRDLRDLLRDLKTSPRDERDDGFIIQGHNADEEETVSKRRHL